MEVNFYSISKRLNSTATPTPGVAGTVLNVKLKEPCTVERPVLELSREYAADVLNCNQCYIPAFARRYWITGREFDGPLFTVSLEVDALGTYAQDIKNSMQYVLRSASASEGAIIDFMYPATTERVIEQHSYAKPWSVDFTAGRYVLGIISHGATAYYLFTANDLNSFIAYLLSDDYLNDVLSSVAIAITSEVKLAIDPLQYIASVTWIPFIPAVAGVDVTSIKVGYVEINTTAKEIMSPLASYLLSASDLPNHPNASRGSYLNAPPYTRATLCVPGFGQFEVDTAELIGSNGLSLSIWVDVRTGTATLDLFVSKVPNSKLISHINSYVGVPIQISQVISAGLGVSTFTDIVGRIFSGGLSGASSGIGGLVAGGVTGAVSALGNALENLVPHATTIGSTGGLDSLGSAFELDYTYFIPVDDMPSQLGRPLCKSVMLSTMSGYCLCSSDCDIAIARATPDEISTILNYMREGFYIE